MNMAPTADEVALARVRKIDAIKAYHLRLKQQGCPISLRQALGAINATLNGNAPHLAETVPAGTMDALIELLSTTQGHVDGESNLALRNAIKRANEIITQAEAMCDAKR